MTSSIDAQRSRILAALLQQAPFDGWTTPTYRQVLRSLAIEELEAELAFPRGIADALDHFVGDADERMERALAPADLVALPFRDRIAKIVRVRLEQNSEHREAIRQAIGAQIGMQFAADRCRGLYRTVDAMWRLAGDTATDFSFYTKRASLAAVYTATLLYWLDDDSPDYVETWSFLARRIENVLAIGKLRGRVERWTEALPNPVRFFRHSPLGGRR
ncbi:MAG: COQ9 family protein [Alphaproteobacteria bacterium]|nr:COQ9 family protein [Alphaproteobacteria bacterium]